MRNICPNHLVLFRSSPSSEHWAPSLSGLHKTSKFLIGYKCVLVILRGHQRPNSDNLRISFLHDNHVSESHSEAGGDQMDWAAVISRRSGVRISDSPVTLVVSCDFLFSAYSNTYGRVRVCGELPISFETTKDIRPMCPIYPFLFAFIIGVVMRRKRVTQTTPTNMCVCSNTQKCTRRTGKTCSSIWDVLCTFIVWNATTRLDVSITTFDSRRGATDHCRPFQLNSVKDGSTYVYSWYEGRMLNWSICGSDLIYFTDVEKSSVLWRSALSSVVWLGDMGFSCRTCWSPRCLHNIVMII